MMFSVLALFVGHSGGVGLGDLQSPWPIVLFVVVAGTVALGNLFPPRKVSFLPGMRYYAGNWDTSLWCIKPSAAAKIEDGIVAIASMPAAQMEKFYGSKETAEMYQYMGVCVPLVQHPRPRDVHAGPPRHGRLRPDCRLRRR